MSSSRGKYSPEFRAEVVREVIDKSRPVADVARDLRIVLQTLTNWVIAHRRADSESEEELMEAYAKRNHALNEGAFDLGFCDAQASFA
ncbi:transposase [Rathayibacter iranicus]|uniref:Transposase n=2 Tax=Rathayibacter iranicus TaxID=59737 RepID=A0AAD1ACP1_9MICO|nr:transposase [Rathayibacter iranicus]MWV32238.1 transposase [Rathayibacter iranicus NCPPB 2253 = VKM Ac-1602]PPI61950.1 transposase [Rathayibacter iranicus]PWJ61536.1 transposase [Rathayibacter iranicus] [Rathayibacter iranicus NCPPB 2253 = VKM Ac-1602]